MNRRFPSCDLVAHPSRWAPIPVGADAERRAAPAAHGAHGRSHEPANPSWEDLLGRR